MASALLSLDVEIPATGRDEKKKHKKKRKQLERDSVSDVATRRGVIYVGHLPHGFFESQLKDYFSQFGTVTKVHVSRNKKVGYNNALVNQIPHYPPPGPMRGFDKGIDERPFPQGGAFDITPFNLCWLKASLQMI